MERLQAVYAAVREQGVLVVPNAGWDGSEAFHTTLSVYKDLGAPRRSSGWPTPPRTSTGRSG